MLSAGSRRDGQDSLKCLTTLGLSEKKVFHRPRDEESANAKNLQNILPHTGYTAVNLETRETVCCRVRAGSAAPRTGRCNVATFSSSSFGKMQTSVL